MDNSAALRKPPAVIPIVLRQHVEEMAVLWHTRLTIVESGAVALRHLARLDARMAAHEDGCVVSGNQAVRILLQELADPDPARLFAAAVIALDLEDWDGLKHCLSVAESVPDSAPGLPAALGWVSRQRLTGVVKDLLTSESTFRRRIGLAACRYHDTDPGPVLRAAVQDSDPDLRAEAFHVAGVLGRRDLLAASTNTSPDEEPTVAFRKAVSAVLLGDRNRAQGRLTRIALSQSAGRSAASQLAVQAMTVNASEEFLTQLVDSGETLRTIIRCTGIVGDSRHIPRLIAQMADDRTTRLAGEAFTLITGADLALLDLERKPPENFESGPNDDPDDPNVDMDPDEGLPWPDPDKIEKWWTANASKFQKGQRYFMGAPVTREGCIEVLKNGYQRQRILAAHYLCLLNPGTPLFNTSAPAWRQQRLLAKM